eukprot:CAMPEP_0117437088 /NCGR_PEP_ID=MMETSP0759-20121206/1341_1 /TAXON_ID=63605 /ORGANISM="Percolomonas cosmopolitus, Strain WS" /LENGTH=810 /DNA_ID=CAMNT_0005228705 /DNA_START=713 /DNA_END=3145 /DNA_ORIENTATION=-
MGATDPVTALNAEELWKKGFQGQDVHVGIFDTGISRLVEDSDHFEHIVETSVYTDKEKTAHDDLGHGTFVSSVIAGKSDQKCRGFAPKAQLHIFKVFTKYQVSYTSWFLDAFNYALHSGINILNLSIGGPDYMDQPFVDKVLELTAHGIIFISAIGNDGPLYGTLNNPADMPSVIGVGGLDARGKIASFSSRGVTTSDLRRGYGRVKPDLVTYGQNVPGFHSRGGCQKLSGTSVSSPIIAGVVTLLSSVVPSNIRFPFLNPGSVKQILQAGSIRIPEANIYEQGAGQLDLIQSYNALLKYTPKISFFPDTLDLTDCPYMWPHCAQPLYYTGMPMILNVTILNGVSLTAKMRECTFISNSRSSMLDVDFTFDRVLWPYSGWLGVKISVNTMGRTFEGDTSGVIRCKIKTPPTKIGENTAGLFVVDLPLKVHVIHTPPREKRILWDQYHSLQYPPGYIPRDDLNIRDDILDWNGDHLHTNFRDFFIFLRKNEYFLEILNGDLISFNPAHYGCLLIVDPEEEFSVQERNTLEEAVKYGGLGLFVFADWYNRDVLEKIVFFDDNTRSKWIPITGGSNLPALNGLLEPFGIAFGNKIYDGNFKFGSDLNGRFSSGSSIAKFPGKSLMGYASLRDQTHSLIFNRHRSEYEVPIFGLTTFGEGRVGVFGDSNCLDSSHRTSAEQCFNFAETALKFLSKLSRTPDSELRRNMKYIDHDLGFMTLDTPLPESTSDLIDLYSSVPREDRVRAAPLNSTEVWRQLSAIRQREEKSLQNHIEGPAVVLIPLFAAIFIVISMVYIVFSRSKFHLQPHHLHMTP